jgi:uncharacterized membrane protein YbhN (UPF0104 family)
VPRRREFEPAGLVAGLVFLTVAAGFALDAAGAWRPSLSLLIPTVIGGMALTSVTAAVTKAVRRGRGESAAEVEE